MSSVPVVHSQVSCSCQQQHPIDVQRSKRRNHPSVFRPKVERSFLMVTMMMILVSLPSTTNAFAPSLYPTKERVARHTLRMYPSSSILQRPRHLLRTSTSSRLAAMTHQDEETTVATENAALDVILQQRIESNLMDDERSKEKSSLRQAIEYLEAHPTLKLSKTNWKLLFDGIEYATASESEQVARAASTRNPVIAFPTLSPARSDMTDLYELLKTRGDLRVFGAARQQLPAAGKDSLIVTPNLWQAATGLPLTALTPSSSSSRSVLLAGIVLASLESIISVVTGIPPNAMLLLTVLAVTVDRFVLNGGVLESLVQKLSPSTVKTIIKHEAGHFLAAYILGCPVEGVVLSAWAALQDARFAKSTTAGTSFFDPDLSKQLNAGSTSDSKTITRSAIERYSITVMAGIAAEANCDQQANGGAGDERALIQFLSSIQGPWATLEAVQNQARWGALQAILLLRMYQQSYDALVDALERGGTLAECVFAIERAARENELPRMVEPTGYIVRDGNMVDWKTPDEVKALAEKQEEEKLQKKPVIPTMSDEEMLRVLSERREQVEQQLRKIEDQLK